MEIKWKAIHLTDKSGVFWLVEIKYEFVNSKNMSGINGIYRIILPTSASMPTLTATGAKDYIATCTINADNPEDYKQMFLEKIYRKKKFKPITANTRFYYKGFLMTLNIIQKKK